MQGYLHKFVTNELRAEVGFWLKRESEIPGYMKRVYLAGIAYQAVIPAQAGIQSNKTLCEAGKTMVQSRFRGECFLNWIPACAGMTRVLY
jgi:hypothetical protein